MDNFEPTIVAFVCNWCSYAGADKAGGQKLDYPANVKLVRVMCSGRVDPQFVMQSFKEGADGVNIAGCCASPCSASSAITRAQAAAGDALSKLVPGKKIDLEVMTTVINEELCAGCKMCIAVCPYKAISFDSEKNASLVNEAICRGCGTCAATCPGGAATAKHFTNKQIYAEIGGILHE